MIQKPGKKLLPQLARRSFQTDLLLSCMLPGVLTSNMKLEIVSAGQLLHEGLVTVSICTTNSVMEMRNGDHNP